MDAETIYNVTLFGLEFKLKPVAFTLPFGDGWNIFWYGILISLGFLLALIYAFRRAKNYQIDPDRMIDVVLVAVPVAVIFARLYYILFDGVKVTSFADVIGIHNGGMAIYGGIIGAFAAGILMCKARKVDALSLFDIASVGFLLAQGIGRWGNFFNQEAFGGATGSSWWGMTSEPIANELGEGVLAHPCFLYESVWCLLGFLLLHLYSKRRKFKGEVFLMYVAWYGFGRFFIEGLRTDQLKLLGIPVSQIVAAVTCIVAVACIIFFRKKIKEEKTDYKPVFSEVKQGMEADAPVLKEIAEKDPAKANEEEKTQGNTAPDADKSITSEKPEKDTTDEWEAETSEGKETEDKD